MTEGHMGPIRNRAGHNVVEDLAIFGAARHHPRLFGPFLAHAPNTVNDFGKTSEKLRENFGA
jgi:hypothetical protein